MQLKHVPVLQKEIIEYLKPASGEHFIDATLGGGGHAKDILAATAPDGKLLGIDMDAEAYANSLPNLGQYNDRITFVQDNFVKIKQIYNEQFKLHKISGILFDLGLSSFELEDPNRGLSFQINGPLDMRFDKRQELTAAEIVNEWPFKKLLKVFQEYGQVTGTMANEVTKKIILARQKTPITKTKILVEAILLAFRDKLKSNKQVPWVGGKHPATKIFQALRIAVNNELDNLEKALPQAIDLLAPGSRVAVISFHSLEDKIVKNYFRQEARDCLCPPQTPTCICRHQASLKIITKKPILPSEDEIKINPRARSARLRVAEKL